MKKEYYLLCFVFSFLAMSRTLAQQLSHDQARDKAETFLIEKMGLRSVGELQLLFVVTDTAQFDTDATSSLRAVTEDNALLYAFGREQGGYVIVSGDERTEAVLGYSAEGILQADNLPEGMCGFLRQYAVEITKVQEQDLRNDARSLSYNPFWKIVDPLISSKWNQGNPYYLQTPVVSGRQCVTGCPATLFAQLVDYYQYQNWKVEKETWFSDYDVKDSVIVQFTDSVEWSLLKRSYSAGSYTEAEANEVAKLMKYAGAAMHVNYGVTTSGQTMENVLWSMHRVADYGQYASFAQAWQYSLREWSEKLYKQLTEKRPLAYASGGGGHIFLLDGYAGEGYFHFNWGWGGNQDGNFLLTSLLPTEDMLFYQAAYFDVCPSWMQPVSEEPLMFDDIELDTADVESAFKVKLFSYNPVPQSGQLCYALAVSEDSVIISDPVEFALEPNKQISEPIVLPFPQYGELTEGVYPLAVFQAMASGWEQMRWNFHVETDSYLVKGEEESFVGVLPYYVMMRLGEESKSLYHGCADTLLLSVMNYGTGMTSMDCTPLLFNETDTFLLTTSTQLLVNGDNSLRLPIRVSEEVPTGDYQLAVVNEFEDSSDTISVTIASGVKLVITEAPVIADTLFVGDNNVFVFKVKNVGVRDFNGTLSTGASLNGEQLYLRNQSLRITVGEEQIYTGGIQSSALGSVALSLQQDKVWPLALISGELFEKTVVFIDKPTAINMVNSGDLQIAWQGQMLCIQPSTQLLAYHIYNASGSVVAAGSVHGNELRIDGSTWSAGVYVVALLTVEGRTVVYKIQK